MWVSIASIHDFFALYFISIPLYQAPNDSSRDASSKILAVGEFVRQQVARARQSTVTFCTKYHKLLETLLQALSSRKKNQAWVFWLMKVFVCCCVHQKYWTPSSKWNLSIFAWCPTLLFGDIIGIVLLQNQHVTLPIFPKSGHIWQLKTATSWDILGYLGSNMWLVPNLSPIFRFFRTCYRWTVEAKQWLLTPSDCARLQGDLIDARPAAPVAHDADLVWI